MLRLYVEQMDAADKMKAQCALWLLQLLALPPLRVLYAISTVMAWVLRVVVRYRRKVVRRNLERALPEVGKERLREIERQFYIHLCDVFFEAIKMLHISMDELRRRVEFTNAPLMADLASRGNSVILYLGHYGNWEWLQLIGDHVPLPKSHKMEVYRPMHYDWIDFVVRHIRDRFDTTLVAQDAVVRQALGFHHAGEPFACAFINDQRPNSYNLRHWAEFLHQDTAISTGGELIGRKVGATFVYVDVEKVDRGRYRVTYVPMEDDGRENSYSLQFLGLMETTIRRAPQYWLWSHDRWRFTRDRQHD